MKFYSYRYKVKTELDKAFNYFLQKDYLVKYFSQQEKQKIEIISENSKNEISEGEEIKLLVKDKKFNILLKLKAEEIHDNQLIKYLIYIDEIEDLEAEDDVDEEDFNSFMKKFFGQKMIYTIDFKFQNDHLIINEISEVLVSNFLAKVFWKVFGLYYRFKQRKIHHQVKMELEQK